MGTASSNGGHPGGGQLVTQRAASHLPPRAGGMGTLPVRAGCRARSMRALRMSRPLVSKTRTSWRHALRRLARGRTGRHRQPPWTPTVLEPSQCRSPTRTRPRHAGQMKSDSLPFVTADDAEARGLRHRQAPARRTLGWRDDSVEARPSSRRGPGTWRYARLTRVRAAFGCLRAPRPDSTKVNPASTRRARGGIDDVGSNLITGRTPIASIAARICSAFET